MSSITTYENRTYLSILLSLFVGCAEVPFRNLWPHDTVKVQLKRSVKAPGVYVLAKNANIMDALIAAGGFETNADLNSVRVISGDETFAYKFDGILERTIPANTLKWPSLYDGDIVIVPDGEWGGASEKDCELLLKKMKDYQKQGSLSLGRWR